ncbi:hypothetical protein [Caldivirga maquilingensis]|uniref:Uncharacterized protein n=1 Tax=Caldivirga maquilingensis (strain ATCC 700844 / DSM 13496 / JCM 10307 / IC-167) TaxID=397948 RepID=A8MBK7_CALMQ|nr:hypothetical protein [Caldivirga maquilingensis]ABW02740.1 hypothetical protein Cmaq_1923 [Caldivirga maquilingensis IC-167]
MYAVVGKTAGYSSRSFEGEYKGRDDVKDVHVVNWPKLSNGLINFILSNDADDLILISFDIPGGGDRVYSRIKETATWLLSPRIDNTTYLTPSHTIKLILLGQIPEEANTVEYLVKPINNNQVNLILRETMETLIKYARARLINLMNARGKAAASISNALTSLAEATLASAKEWTRRSFELNLSMINNLVETINDAVEFKLSKNKPQIQRPNQGITHAWFKE